jgi:hypothetical protein
MFLAVDNWTDLGRGSWSVDINRYVHTAEYFGLLLCSWLGCRIQHAQD